MGELAFLTPIHVGYLKEGNNVRHCETNWTISKITPLGNDFYLVELTSVEYSGEPTIIEERFHSLDVIAVYVNP